MAHILLVIALAAVSARAAFTPIVDAPFREVIAHRFTSVGTPAVAGWGTLPFRNQSQVLVGKIVEQSGVFAVTSNGLYFLSLPDGKVVLKVVLDAPIAVDVDARVALASDGTLGVLAADGALYSLSCFVSSSEVKCSTTVLAKEPTLKAITGIAVQAWTTSSRACYVSCIGGLFRYAGGVLTRIWNTPALSVAYSHELGLAAAGDISFVAIFRDGTKVNQEWVTELDTASGGAYDGPARALAFDSDGVLIQANEICLNVRFPNASLARVGYLQGLPYNETTSVAVEPSTNVVWIGTQKGAVRWDRSTRSWSYYYLQRYLPGTSRVASLSSGFNCTAVATDGGISILEDRFWTLAQKADYYETVLDRHDRVGLVGDCSLSTFGNISSCFNHDDDNNGLWTSLVVGAEAFRYATTGDARALQRAVHFYEGMYMLNEITGIRGLMARSAVRPGEQHGDGSWHFSQVPKYAGWQWKGDTSSDEVVGHTFAFNVMARLVFTTGDDHKNVTDLLGAIVNYIVKNDFYLIDVTGKPTTWGVWNPLQINYDRFWSDEHGVNAIQILAYLRAAIELTGDADGSLRRAYAGLVNETNHYDFNTINAKIVSPDDDNFSDDELTFMPYHVMFTSDGSKSNPSLVASLRRTWAQVRSLRSDLWNAIYIAVDGEDADQTDVDSIVWNLQTWPLELVDWPVMNSHRRDVRLDINADRTGQYSGDSVRVLPANERVQYRWNANPHDLDGGSGTSECDPGAWLLPYWMARYYHLIV